MAHRETSGRTSGCIRRQNVKMSHGNQRTPAGNSGGNRVWLTYPLPESDKSDRLTGLKKSTLLERMKWRMRTSESLEGDVENEKNGNG